jgi:hypothetical protein
MFGFEVRVFYHDEKRMCLINAIMTALHGPSCTYLIFGNMFAQLDMSIHDITYDLSLSQSRLRKLI